MRHLNMRKSGERDLGLPNPRRDAPMLACMIMIVTIIDSACDDGLWHPAALPSEGLISICCSTDENNEAANHGTNLSCQDGQVRLAQPPDPSTTADTIIFLSIHGANFRSGQDIALV